MKKNKFVVTSALPYANGPLHLGHIAGAYLPADIYTRFNRLVGNDILFVCGTDEHGVPITLSAEKENVTPRTIVKRYHEDIKKVFERLNISFDYFSGTSNLHNKHHAKLSREFFIKLYKNKLINSKLQDQYFCEKCERYLADRYLEGICPKCGHPEARGDECSNCNYQFDPLTLKEPKCKICSAVPKIRTTKHWYLRLNVLQQELEQWIDSKDYWKENVVNFVKGWFKEGLRERAITRDLYWGVPVPLDEAAGKVLYVWFDAPIGYISATIQYFEEKGDKEKWREYWQNPDCNIVHFIGKDNIPFHAIIWPSILLGQREKYQLPWHIPANEYLNFGLSQEEDGIKSKASTSKGNVVWAHESLDSFDVDYIRYYLAACAPEKSDTTFTWKDFQLRCNGELLGVLGNFANRVLKFIAHNFDSKIPEPGKLEKRDKEFLATIHEAPAKVHKLYKKFEVRQVVAEIVNLGRLGNQYFDEKAPWKSVKENRKDCEACMFVSVQLVQTLAVLLSPIIPGSSQKLWLQLGHTSEIANWDEDFKELSAGHAISKPEGIFAKIDNKVIAAKEEQLAKAIATSTETAEETTVEIPPFKEGIIDFETFSQLDIRIGEIVAAQKVPKAKKLLQLKVKVGADTRQIIAGIAQYYKPEDIVGKKVPLLINLKPVKIRGLLSEGMILCADIEGEPILLSPQKDVPPGAIVR